MSVQATAVGSDSLAAIQSLLEETPKGRIAYSQQYDIDYHKFCDTVEAALSSYIKLLECNPYENGCKSENQLNIDLVNMLKVGKFNASHGEYTGGHTDLMVRNHNDNSQIWIGEGKKHESGISVIMGGFKQLSTRYVNGRQNCNRGGMLIYSIVSDTKKSMLAWQNAAITNGVILAANPLESDLSFLSIHESQASGMEVQIRHFIVTLYFNPEDRSGVKSSKGRNNQLVLDI